MALETFTWSPMIVSYGRGPEWRTLRTEFESGKHQTRAKWSAKRMVFHLLFRKNKTDTDAIIAFFNAREGRYDKFYWTDPNSETQYSVRFNSDTLEVRNLGKEVYELNIDFIEAK